MLEKFHLEARRTSFRRISANEQESLFQWEESMKSFVIQENDKDQRLDKFLQKTVPLLPKNLLYKSIRTKRIKVNRKRCELSYRLKEGDVVELYLQDEFFEDNQPKAFLQVPSKIDVVYEDRHILLVDKPQGLVVHEDNENTQDTLINRVQHYLYEQGEFDPDQEQSFAPALCNRIDRNTCGIVIVAKTAAALRILNEKIKNRELVKKYLCILTKRPPKSHDTLTHYLEKLPAGNRVVLYPSPHPNARTAVTEYRVLRQEGDLTLAEINLKTGRTHQIRAHMAYIGCPLLGDGKYGSNTVNKQYGVKQQALCSYYLKLAFREDGGELDYLNGKAFTVDHIWFCDRFFPKQKK